MVPTVEYDSSNCMDMLAAGTAIRERLFKPRKQIAVESEPVAPKIVKNPARKRYDDHIERYYRYKWLLSKTEKTGRPTVRKIIETLCLGTEYTYDDIVGPGRRRGLCSLRQFIHVEVIGIRTDMPVAAIARQMNRDHTVLLYSLDKLHMERYGVPRETAARGHRLYPFDGTWVQFNELSRRCNVSSSMLYKRLISLGSVKEALKKPLRGEMIMCGGVPAWTLMGDKEP